MAVRCPSCGTENASFRTKCKNCGADLSSVRPGLRGAPGVNVVFNVGQKTLEKVTGGVKIKCAYCGTDYSKDEANCPSCGAPNPSRTKPEARWAKQQLSSAKADIKWRGRRGLPSAGWKVTQVLTRPLKIIPGLEKPAASHLVLDFVFFILMLLSFTFGLTWLGLAFILLMFYIWFPGEEVTAQKSSFVTSMVQTMVREGKIWEAYELLTSRGYSENEMKSLLGGKFTTGKNASDFFKNGKCPRCGAPIPQDANKCEYCGQEFR